MTSLLTRRDLFGRSKAGKPEQRPPWSRPEAEFLEACARCGACIEACPTGVLVEGSSQYPAIRFGTAACTLCAACAQACPTTCFDAELDPPWPVKAHIGNACIETQGVACRACEDACDYQAISFQPRRGGGSSATVSQVICTGCGSCTATCPVKAITLEKLSGHEVLS